MKRAPYTGKAYTNINYKLDEIGQVKELFSIFENFKPPTEVLILAKKSSIAMRKRYENPRKEVPFFFENNDNGLNKQALYCKELFGEETCNSYFSELYVGQGTSHFCYFEINYAINQEAEENTDEFSLDIEDGLIGGELSMKFYFKNTLCGVSKGKPIGEKDLNDPESFQEKRLLFNSSETENSVSIQVPLEDPKSDLLKEMERIRLINAKNPLNFGELFEKFTKNCSKEKIKN